jgi:hypothetical protein
MEGGSAFAARALAAMDEDVLISGLAQHVRVFDVAARAQPSSDDDTDDWRGGGSAGQSFEIGGYVIEAHGTASADAWDAIVAALVLLDSEDPARFQRLMRGCRRLSDSAPEIDGLHDLFTARRQDGFDLAIARERRRAAQGFVTPAEAQAFLTSARTLPLDAPGAPQPHPAARAYFRAVEQSRAATLEAADHSGGELSAALEAVADILTGRDEPGPRPRALLASPDADQERFPHLQHRMEYVSAVDPIAHAARIEELAYLANVLTAGCTIQMRALTAAEASDAAAAVCNLGLENWPERWWPSGDDILIGNDLIGAYQVGWAVLHRRVSMFAAEQLLEVLADARCRDRETQRGLETLRATLTIEWRAGTPWRAGEALDALMALDMAAWAALVGLLGECPVLHGVIDASERRSPQAVSASAFEFIARNSHIDRIRRFLASLRARLSE